MADIYFNADCLGEPVKSYVAFLDVMGMQNHLASSLKTSANFMFKFHAAILSTWKAMNAESSKIKIYPIMDGAYIAIEDAKTMKAFISTLFFNLAILFLNEKNDYHRFVPRGAVSYGELHHGCSVPDEASLIFSENKDYRANLLIGKPMVKAYQNERNAAPFGIYIDDCSSCSFHEDGDSFFKEWKWYKERLVSSNYVEGVFDAFQLAEALLKLFSSLAETEADSSQVARHQAHYRQVKRYFCEF